MKRHILILGVACVIAALVFAQAPPQTKPQVTPRAEQNDPDACSPTTLGQGADVDNKQGRDKTWQDKNLSDKLARSNGVICPPSHVDPDMRQPAQGGGNMPVIPPPGSPGGNQQIQPK